MKTSILNYLLVITTIIVISACSNPNLLKEKKTIEPLVNVQWLNDHLEDKDLVILDTTVIVEMDSKGGFTQKSGESQYKKGHIPYARFADLLNDFSAKNELDFIMPSPQKFKKSIENLGIGDNSTVVLYSADRAVWATRMWWMLRWVGFDNVAILDGGLRAWQTQGHALSSEIPQYTTNSLTLNIRPGLIAYKDEVLTGIENNRVDLFDAMPGPHYYGQFSMYSRPGHIQSALNIPTTELVEESGIFKPLDELDLLIDGNKNNRSITYCGGGVAASAVAFSMYRLGYEDVAVYMGSLQEWVVDPENPMTIVGSD